MGLFGPMNTSKTHRLAYHLLDELQLRGNLIDADTSVNDMLHKLCTIMHQRSIKIADQIMLQRMRCKQTLAFVTAEDEALEMMRTAGLSGPDDELLDETAERQATAEQDFLDGRDARGLVDSSADGDGGELKNDVTTKGRREELAKCPGGYNAAGRMEGQDQGQAKRTSAFKG